MLSIARQETTRVLRPDPHHDVVLADYQIALLHFNHELLVRCFAAQLEPRLLLLVVLSQVVGDGAGEGQGVGFEVGYVEVIVVSGGDVGEGNRKLVLIDELAEVRQSAKVPLHVLSNEQLVLLEAESAEPHHRREEGAEGRPEQLVEPVIELILHRFELHRQLQLPHHFVNSELQHHVPCLVSQPVIHFQQTDFPQLARRHEVPHHTLDCLD